MPHNAPIKTELDFALELNLEDSVPAIFVGPSGHDPHSDLMASDEGMMILDIPDPKIQARLLAQTNSGKNQ